MSFPNRTPQAWALMRVSPLRTQAPLMPRPIFANDTSMAVNTAVIGDNGGLAR